MEKLFKVSLVFLRKANTDANSQNRNDDKYDGDENNRPLSILPQVLLLGLIRNGLELLGADLQRLRFVLEIAQIDIAF